MSDQHNPSEESLRLTNDTPVVTDFTIAQTFANPDRVRILHELFVSEWTDRDSIILDADTIRGAWEPTDELTERELESVFVCLSSNGAATELTPGDSYVEYTFEVNVSQAQSVLDQQLVAACALAEAESPTQEQQSAVDPVATVPEDVDLSHVDTLAHTRGRVRRLLMNAMTSVRVANPYFETDRAVLEDLASLPSQGIDTRILTRETDDPSDDLREALNDLHDAVETDATGRLEVRDLYDVDPESGHQETATHAKLIIIDGEACYVGSANFTYHSLHRNFEFGLLLTGPPTDTITEVYDAVFEYADRVHLPLHEP